MGILSSPEKSQALRDNLLSCARRGYHTGSPPFGYVKARPGSEVSLINEHEAPTIREAFRLACDGRTVAEIALLLRVSGLFGRDGKPLGRSSVHALLTNPHYAGYVRLNGNIYPGRHAPLVSPATFAAAADLLSGRRATWSAPFD